MANPPRSPVRIEQQDGPDLLLSICIPSYNRPELLTLLLGSVDADIDSAEIVICENDAPRREEVRAVVDEFRDRSPYTVRYHENERNLGYDRNLRELIRRARGRFVLFIGDDDQFMPGMLDRFLHFLRQHADAGYVLRSYAVEHDDGSRELFRYFPGVTHFAPGLASYVVLFRRSVTLAGFTFRRELADEFLTDEFDGTLLFQVYLAAELALRYPSVYCDIPVALVQQTYRSDDASFGSSDVEKDGFVPGKVLPSNSVHFMKGFFRITRALDRKYGFESTQHVRKDISRYSYPVLSIQRKRGMLEFLRYVGMLNREIGINTTPHYHLYVAALLLVGERACDRAIVRIKSILGRTPRL